MDLTNKQGKSNQYIRLRGAEESKMRGRAVLLYFYIFKSWIVKTSQSINILSTNLKFYNYSSS